MPDLTQSGTMIKGTATRKWSLAPNDQRKPPQMNFVALRLFGIVCSYRPWSFCTEKADHQAMETMQTKHKIHIIIIYHM